MTGSYSFTAEIRDATNHQTSKADEESGVTVTDNGLHERDVHYQYENAGSVRIYLRNHHDQGFDVETHHTTLDDTDFAASNVHSTETVAANGGVATFVMDGPVGRLQFKTLTGSLSTAPTSGSLDIGVIAE